jgi:hypothetical protein
MEFTEETLRKIECMGISGYPLTRVTPELNTTPGELKKERLTNKRLDDALRRYEFNAESYFAGKMMENVISQNKSLFAETYVQVYNYLREKTGSF